MSSFIVRLDGYQRHGRNGRLPRLPWKWKQ